MQGKVDYNLLNMGLKLEKMIHKNDLIEKYISVCYKKDNKELDDICIKLIKKSIQNHIILTKTMIRFYLYFRLKELKLKQDCTEIVIKKENENIFGSYEISRKTLTIYLDYILTKYKKLLKINNISTPKAHDFLNIEILRMT